MLSLYKHVYKISTLSYNYERYLLDIEFPNLLYRCKEFLKEPDLNILFFNRYSPKFLKKTKAVPLSLARKKYPRPSPQYLMNAMENSLSFLIVRHPFERLLSAYRDKMQYSLPHTYHRQLGNKIIIQYRKKKVINS